MIILNNGLPKSATTLLKKWQEKILSFHYPQNGMEEFIHSNTGGYGSFVDHFDQSAYDCVLQCHEKCGSLIVKLHSPPTVWLRKLIQEHGAKMTLCYRDPRAIILSAMDHATRSRKGLDSSNAFSDLHTVSDTLVASIHWLSIFEEWDKDPTVLKVQYERLIPQKKVIFLEMLTHFDLAMPDEFIEDFLHESELAKKSAWNFNQEDPLRWKKSLSSQEIDLIESKIGAQIVKMGYPITSTPVAVNPPNKFFPKTFLPQKIRSLFSKA
jgi:hypothetical protein